MQNNKSTKKPAKAPSDKKADSGKKNARDADRVAKRNKSNVPLFLKKTRSVAQGNQQDEKDETPE